MQPFFRAGCLCLCSENTVYVTVSLLKILQHLVLSNNLDDDDDSYWLHEFLLEDFYAFFKGFLQKLFSTPTLLSPAFYCCCLHCKGIQV
jgi:hypothetical protein